MLIYLSVLGLLRLQLQLIRSKEKQEDKRPKILTESRVENPAPLAEQVRLTELEKRETKPISSAKGGAAGLAFPVYCTTPPGVVITGPVSR